MSDVFNAAVQARQQFMDLVADVRPELHRYCTRMTGSVFDGEDVVQDTLAKAWFALAEMESTPALRGWLFRIAHNTAMDHLRRYESRNVAADDDIAATADSLQSREVEEQGPDAMRVDAAIKVFASLPPVQRSALALKDVLNLTLEETATTMGTTVAAVKGALVRARANVASMNAHGANTPRDVDTARLRNYAELFNARDWDGLRALFGEETRLDLVSRHQLKGRAAAQYFNRYAELIPREELRAVAGWVDGVPSLAIYRPGVEEKPAYFIRLDWHGEEVALVRDFRHVWYIAHESTFTTNQESH